MIQKLTESLCRLLVLMSITAVSLSRANAFQPATDADLTMERAMGGTCPCNKDNGVCTPSQTAKNCGVEWPFGNVGDDCTKMTYGPVENYICANLGNNSGSTCVPYDGRAGWPPCAQWTHGTCRNVDVKIGFVTVTVLECVYPDSPTVTDDGLQQLTISSENCP
jgi:hypothetical protein